MKNLLTFISILILVVTNLSCNYLIPTAHFLIRNEVQEQPNLQISISFAGDKIFDDTVQWTNIVPRFETINKQTQKGKYVIEVKAENGKINVTQPIMLDSDRWIFIIYVDHKSEKHDSVYVKVQPYIDISIVDEEPKIL